MAKYVFLNFPTYGQVNPTLAVVRELVSRGEEVVYFNFEKFRPLIEATGSKFRPYDAELFRRERSQNDKRVDDNRRLALLPIYMIQTSRQMVPPLLERVQAEGPDCLVYSDVFLWARIIAHALDIPGATLRPTYAPGPRFTRLMLEGAGLPFPPPATPEWLSRDLTHLRETYALPFPDIASLIKGNEDLAIVFLVRASQPEGDSFSGRFLFVGPAFHPDRDRNRDFPFEKLDSRPRLYISLGTVFNDRIGFYHTCFDAFGGTGWQVVLSVGDRIDSAALGPIPDNFIAASWVPQLEILRQTDIFISHGGMNSTMESLYYGVPLVVIPHLIEQKITASRVQELRLGVELDETALDQNALKGAVSRIAHEPGFKKRLLTMQRHAREAGGYQRAADALQGCVAKRRSKMAKLRDAASVNRYESKTDLIKRE